MPSGVRHRQSVLPFCKKLLRNITTPPDCQQRDTGRDKITASWAYIHWGCPGLMGVDSAKGLWRIDEVLISILLNGKTDCLCRPLNQMLCKGLTYLFTSPLFLTGFPVHSVSSIPNAFASMSFIPFLRKTSIALSLSLKRKIITAPPDEKPMNAYM